MGDGRAEGSSAIGDRRRAAISLTPDIDGMHVCIFESLQLEGSYLGELLYVKPSANSFPDFRIQVNIFSNTM